MNSFFSKLLGSFGNKTRSSSAALAVPRVIDEVSNKMSNKYPEKIAPSPQTNGAYARKITPKVIVMHDTEGNYEGSIDWTSRVNSPSGKRLYASYHCIVARDGRRTVTNRDDNRAYHAGISSFKDMKSLNHCSIGVAFERSSYTEPLQVAAIESAIEYIAPLMKKWDISIDMVTDHRTIAPNRKKDLNPKEFAKFHEALKKHFK